MRLQGEMIGYHWCSLEGICMSLEGEMIGYHWCSLEGMDMYASPR